MGAAAGTAQQAGRRYTTARSGVYRPRRPQASPLYRLIEDHFDELSTIHDEGFARRWGYWRKVVGEVVEMFQACGILKHGFARVRCGGCMHEFLLAFSCKCRYFCPSCHAKRLALWGIWLEETLCGRRPTTRSSRSDWRVTVPANAPATVGAFAAETPIAISRMEYEA